MQLSVIIVSYNVKFFLEQCLCSVEKAIYNINVEIWVVDNASADNSVQYLQPRFPFVHFIRNEVNVGFAKANNQALRQAKGEYVLFLNPDTILPEDCLEKCLSFMELNKDAGGLGIRMIDGSGAFLPESKRSFPSPLTAFYKLTGLTSLFPRSRIFARYNLGYLDEHQNHEVDVLAGAFMMAKKELLIHLNGFDETFFMYGEDVDLSYRIQQAGYKNYYFAQSAIIHFKGESTKKGSLNYIRMFYQAMSIFVKKHYGGRKAWLFTFFIQIAIWLHAISFAVVNFIYKIGLPLLDTIIIFGSFKLTNDFWVHYVRHGQPFIPVLINLALPGFTLVFLLAATFAGIYDNKYKPAKAFYAAGIATVVMLAVYSLLPEQYRFSRGVIFTGGLMALLFITFFRWILSKWGVAEEDYQKDKRQKMVIVATRQEYSKVMQILSQSGVTSEIIGRIAPGENTEDAIGTIDRLPDLIKSFSWEFLFCEGYLSFAAIIEIIQKLPAEINARFHAGKSNSIVGSFSKNTVGESFSGEQIFNLSQPYYRRMKRMVDCMIAFLFLLTFPLHLLVSGIGILKDALRVITGKKTWVGYAFPSKEFPVLPKGVLTPTGNNLNTFQVSNAESLQKIDHWYAKDYDPLQDVKLIIKNYKRLGNRKPDTI